MISVILITKNAATKISEALASVKGLAEEIIVVDGGSTDGTIDIAEKYGARVIRQKGKGYADWRSQGLKEARGDWILYLDYDERVTPGLKEELMTVTGPAQKRVLPLASPTAIPPGNNTGAPSVGLPGSRHPLTAFAIPRRNIVFGKELRYGGWRPDYVKRLYQKSALKKWVGELHEEPVFEGALGHLKNPMIHQKEDNLSDMVRKTNEWSEVEAKLLLASGHPKMSWWRFFRIMTTEFWDRFIRKLAFLDGAEGIIYGIYQIWSRFLTYAKLWEMQQR